MKVLVSGASGFLGSQLLPALRARGHELRSVGRSGADHDWSPESVERGVEWCEAIVALAGENILGARWNPAFKQRLWSSRFETTRALAHFAARHGTRAFVGASAIGFYGPRGDEELDERASRGGDFLAQLCGDWEEALAPAAAAGVRCCSPRIGVVLGRGGGALARMLPFFRLGLGGPVGSGRQWFSWIHAGDLVALLCWLLESESARGVYNATAPGPVTMGEFARTLGRVLHRPALLPVPALALRLRFGEGADVLVSGQRVLPARALAEGFRFAHPALEGALLDLVGAQESARA
jgi:uncharacterized protein (TIGR01777 family)